MVNLVGFCLALGLCYFVREACFKKEDTPTAAGAIVMAIGIFLYSAMQEFNIYAYGEMFGFILAAIWFLIVLSIIQTIRDRSFKQKHLQNPIQLFAIGTWVAGTSVLGNVIHQFSLNLGIFPYVMGCLNIFLYIWYLTYVLPAYRKIIGSELRHHVHGVLLLSTVSTQSIVLLLYNIFEQILPTWANKWLITLGLGLYVIGFILILFRYLFKKKWDLANEWKNTNCIIHGAISITGLATATTGAFGFTVQYWLWVWVIFFFIVIETVEIVRAIVRVKIYGWLKGIGSYDVSQWSRNFTFGMLFAFTNKFQLSETSVFFPIHQLILVAGPWLVLFFLLAEILLFFKAKIRWNESLG